MKLTRRLNNILEKVITINLEGKEYQLNVQNAIKALIEYEMDNPDMGNPDDYKDNSERRRIITKNLKDLDVVTVVDQIELWVGEGEMSVKDLLKSKAISKLR